MFKYLVVKIKHKKMGRCSRKEQTWAALRKWH